MKRVSNFSSQSKRKEDISVKNRFVLFFCRYERGQGTRGADNAKVHFKLSLALRALPHPILSGALPLTRFYRELPPGGRLSRKAFFESHGSCLGGVSRFLMFLPVLTIIIYISAGEMSYFCIFFKYILNFRGKRLLSHEDWCILVLQNTL